MIEFSCADHVSLGSAVINLRNNTQDATSWKRVFQHIEENPKDCVSVVKSLIGSPALLILIEDSSVCCSAVVSIMKDERETNKLKYHLVQGLLELVNGKVSTLLAHSERLKHERMVSFVMEEEEEDSVLIDQAVQLPLQSLLLSLRPVTSYFMQLCKTAKGSNLDLLILDCLLCFSRASLSIGQRFEEADMSALLQLLISWYKADSMLGRTILYLTETHVFEKPLWKDVVPFLLRNNSVLDRSLSKEVGSLNGSLKKRTLAPLINVCLTFGRISCSKRNKLLSKHPTLRANVVSRKEHALVYVFIVDSAPMDVRPVTRKCLFEMLIRDAQTFGELSIFDEIFDIASSMLNGDTVDEKTKIMLVKTLHFPKRCAMSLFDCYLSCKGDLLKSLLKAKLIRHEQFLIEHWIEKENSLDQLPLLRDIFSDKSAFLRMVLAQEHRFKEKEKLWQALTKSLEFDKSVCDVIVDCVLDNPQNASFVKFASLASNQLSNLASHIFERISKVLETQPCLSEELLEKAGNEDVVRNLLFARLSPLLVLRILTVQACDEGYCNIPTLLLDRMTRLYEFDQVRRISAEVLSKFPPSSFFEPLIEQLKSISSDPKSERCLVSVKAICLCLSACLVLYDDSFKRRLEESFALHVFDCVREVLKCSETQELHRALVEFCSIVWAVLAQNEVEDAMFSLMQREWIVSAALGRMYQGLCQKDHVATRERGLQLFTKASKSMLSILLSASPMVQSNMLNAIFMMLLFEKESADKETCVEIYFAVFKLVDSKHLSVQMGAVKVLGALITIDKALADEHITSTLFLLRELSSNSPHEELKTLCLSLISSVL